MVTIAKTLSRRASRTGIRPCTSTMHDHLMPLLPGLALVVLLAAVAQGLSMLLEAVLGRILIEGLVLSMLLGLLFRASGFDLRHFDRGAAYASKQVLEVAVVLLGVGVNTAAIAALGPRLAILIPVCVVVVLVLGYGIGRGLGLGPRLALLVATGNAICGNSAIAAVAPIIKADKHEIASSIALTAVLGVMLVFLLPLLIPLVGLSLYQYGVVAGMGVYAVPQVLAAAFPVSEISGEVATTVKLGRVLLLGPIMLAIGVVVGHRGAGRGNAAVPFSTVLPWFVVGFVLTAALRASGVLPDIVVQPARTVGSWLTLLAMAGLGLGVRLSVVRVRSVRAWRWWSLPR